MKLAIAITACNRPEYLEYVLYTLARNAGHASYKMHFAIEPVNLEVIAIANAVDWIETEVVVNPTVFGVRKNPFEMLSRVFDAGYDGVLYLEDDVRLARDAVALADWYFRFGNADRYLCLNFYNHNSVANGDSSAVLADEYFSALGMGLTRKQWYEHFKPAWFTHQDGWDFSFQALINDGARVLQPIVSRSHHIGRENGTYYNADLYDHLYVNNPFYEGLPVKDFHINS